MPDRIRTKYAVSLSYTIGIAVFYVLGAQLGYLVALPPGTSLTLFWPPSGIALAATVLMGRQALGGVFLGALVTALIGLSAFSFGTMLGVALAIATATTLAINVAYSFLIRFAPSAPIWTSASDLLFGSMGMGLACLISAFFGTLSLYLSGILPVEQITSGLGTWWLGEFCGMIIFTPLAFAVVRRNTGKFWRRKRPGVVLSPTILNSVITAIALSSYMALWVIEGNNISIAMEREAAIAANGLTQGLRKAEADMNSIRALMSASDRISNAQFQRYADTLFGGRSRDPGTQAVGWAPRVYDSKAWDLKMLQTGDAQTRLFERGESGNRPVSERDEYFPVEFIYPLDDVNRKAIGFDLASEKLRREALELARDTGYTSIVAPITLVQSDREEPGMLICQPIYRPGKPLDTIEARRENLIGVASGVYYLDAVSEIAFASAMKDVDFHLFDKGLPKGEQWLYTRGAALSDDDKSTDSVDTPTILNENFTGTATIDFANRNWLLMATPSANSAISHRTWTPWGALIFFLLLGIGGSSLLIERLATKKRIKSEQQKTEKALFEARAANESKSYFMAAASHDIKQPLYALSILTDTLLMSDPPEETKPIVKGLRRSIKEMSQHFDTLMDVGRFQDGGFEPHLSRVSLGDLARRIDLEISPLCKDKGLNWIIDIEDAVVFTDAELLLRLTRNLLTNAVRYTPEGTVQCSAKIKGESVEFRLSDTGVGLTAEQQQLAISGIVKLRGDELHGSVHGLGLSIVNKIDHALGLGMKIDSNPEYGTVFTFQLPRATEF